MPQKLVTVGFTESVEFLSDLGLNMSETIINKPDEEEYLHALLVSPDTSLSLKVIFEHATNGI